MTINEAVKAIFGKADMGMFRSSWKGTYKSYVYLQCLPLFGVVLKEAVENSTLHDYAIRPEDLMADDWETVTLEKA